MNPALPDSLHEALRWLGRNLEPARAQGEPATLALHLLEDLLDLPRPWPSLRRLDAGERARILQAVERLQQGEPLAYVTGVAHFLDLRLRIDRRALIPRPETEELAMAVLDAWKGQTPRILDVGTGSACLALALARGLPGSAVYALDLSGDALALARQNAAQLDVPLRLLQGDFLDAEYRAQLPQVDLVVSNPPYIDPEEKLDLEPHVRAYEPPEALFAPKGDPLAFYRAAVEYLQSAMPVGNRPRGFLETSALTATDALVMAKARGMDAELWNDLSGMPRILILP
jgi:release factor glutamine methyltransferase